jgi:hypothetical protein
VGQRRQLLWRYPFTERYSLLTSKTSVLVTNTTNSTRTSSSTHFISITNEAMDSPIARDRIYIVLVSINFRAFTAK